MAKRSNNHQLVGGKQYFESEVQTAGQLHVDGVLKDSTTIDKGAANPTYVTMIGRNSSNILKLSTMTKFLFIYIRKRKQYACDLATLCFLFERLRPRGAMRRE